MTIDEEAEKVHPSKAKPGGPILFAVPQADSLSDEEFGFFFAMASPQRKNRAKRFLRREDACRSIVAEALIRYALNSCTGGIADELNLIDNEYGKPYLADRAFYFNVSHSGALVICGIDKYEIGVDVEKKHAISHGIADRFFSRAEIDFLGSRQAETDRFEMFFKIWSLKESYIKAIGKGLSCPLHSFACIPSMENENIEFCRYDETLPIRYFRLIDLDNDYSCAVCVCHGETSVVTRVIAPTELIEMLRNSTEKIDRKID